MNIEDIEEEYNKCPECGSDTEELIGYMYGYKICEGYKCKECNWEIIF